MMVKRIVIFSLPKSYFELNPSHFLLPIIFPTHIVNLIHVERGNLMLHLDEKHMIINKLQHKLKLCIYEY